MRGVLNDRNKKEFAENTEPRIKDFHSKDALIKSSIEEFALGMEQRDHYADSCTCKTRRSVRKTRYPAQEVQPRRLLRLCPLRNPRRDLQNALVAGQLKWGTNFANCLVLSGYW
jgi:hypothetical protein